MNPWAEKRIAVAALIEAGKTTNAIAADLKGSRSLVLKVKRRLAAGKDLQVSPRKVKKPVLTSRVVGGLKKKNQGGDEEPAEGSEGGQHF